ncbi:hypothetical protein TNCV_4839731 [Trichonephila clavipes]|nr:hypothetical protein TNCV_4839731 [Trichonephila clavipes]
MGHMFSIDDKSGKQAGQGSNAISRKTLQHCMPYVATHYIWNVTDGKLNVWEDHGHLRDVALPVQCVLEVWQRNPIPPQTIIPVARCIAQQLSSLSPRFLQTRIRSL